jgi:peptidoglycan/LPS O-acetylase OafA/YrhL
MTYRRDIDGLRAIAVLAVMLYHFGLSSTSGGYVGVDIFFVISGYLIGGNIIDETTSKTFSYIQFYLRRIKRLFPAIFVLSLATIPFAWWLLLPEDFRSYGKSLVATTTFLPNVLFYRETGYFSTDAVTKPLLHTWSLGVEEQFYICFPIVVRLIIRAAPKLAASLLFLICIVSLGFSQRLMNVDPPAAFYWLPARAWELALGALVASPTFRTLSLGSSVRRPVTWLALAMLVVPVFLYSDATPFPGVTALPPCLATAWLLWTGKIPETSAGWLGAPASVFIGRISYSLYLWHWPVYMFLAYYLSGNLPWTVRIGGLALVFALATLSWRWVEQPIRTRRISIFVTYGGAIIGSLLLVSVGFLIWRLDGVPSRFSNQTAVLATAASDFNPDWKRCVGKDNPSWPGVAYCPIGIPGPPTFLIWGDSHIRSLHDGVDKLAHELGRSGIVVWAAGCMPAFDIKKRETAVGAGDDAECATQNAALKSVLQHNTSIAKVLLLGRWSYYFQGHGVGIDRQNLIEITNIDPEKQAGLSLDEAGRAGLALRNTVHWLKSAGFEVYVLEQVPEITNYTSHKLFQLVRSGQHDVAHAIALFGTEPRADVDRRQREANEVLEQLAGEGTIRILRTHQFFCGPVQCSAWTDWGPAYFDNNHLTVTTSQHIRKVFLPLMQ